jgi:hypothetical protein
MPFGMENALANRKDLILALTWRRLFNHGSRVFVNSLPKSGTHLLNRCLSIMPGMAYAGYHLNARKTVKAKEGILKRLGGGCFVSAHLPFSERDWVGLQDLGYKQVLMIRDPRDLIVSQFHFVSKRPVARLYPYFAELPDDDSRIMAAIRGVPNHDAPDGIGLPDIGTRFEQYLEWGKHGSHVVRFENLVGKAGGGSYERQLAEVEALARHVDISLPGPKVKEIAEQVFSRSAKTFRKGEIGDWRNTLSTAHKNALKELVGRLLIDLGYEKNLDW